ncbi:YhjD/YihY/BrkB family envelope integrity protein [Desulfolutivibrio sulfoxidireducens]|uniref:YhjD/YihY/BrkB family envelope integrity protein n=1 Tax=Desulfolutivibrio sulfoxidireducens TaxID=2773299 RepID=UPI003B848DCB
MSHSSPAPTSRPPLPGLSRAVRAAAKDLPGAAAFVLTSFFRDRCLMQASALSFATVLSIVPFLAVAFAVTKGLGLYDAPQVRSLLLGLAAGQAEVADAVLQYIQNTNVKALGVVGTAFLLVTAVSLVGTIESALNAVWKASTDRGFRRRFVNYVTLILVCPVFLFAAFGATAGLRNMTLVRWLLEFTLVSRAYLLFLSLLPYLMIWMAFFLLYMFLPNTRVRFSSAALSAILAGTLWQMTQKLYIEYQAAATGYNAVYGSFAQIPLLFVWLYVSWVIVLAGAEVGHALQRYRDIRDQERDAGLSPADRRTLGLALLALLARDADDRSPPTSTPALADRLDAPRQGVQRLLAVFGASGIAAGVSAPNGETVWLLSAPPDKITVAEAVAAMDRARPNDAPGPPEFLTRNAPLVERLAALSEQARETATLRDLAQGEGACDLAPTARP